MWNSDWKARLSARWGRESHPGKGSLDLGLEGSKFLSTPTVASGQRWEGRAWPRVILRMEAVNPLAGLALGVGAAFLLARSGGTGLEPWE